tara:strand:+ start:1153 stop:2112 length:960 start_codon:yes stop_codon:yes gene_type:complete
MKILITGSSGFIGFHLSRYLLSKKHLIYGLDNLNKYYDIKLKDQRLKILSKYKKFKFYKLDINETKKIEKIIIKNKISHVIHLAAQAGVRFSILNPQTYVKNNINGFFSILQACKNTKIKHLIYASTSSVYGNDNRQPSKETNSTDFPLSFYAATKKSNEVMAYAFSNIYGLSTTGLRFFTVYGSYGRPDMALFKFSKAIKERNTIYLYNNGNHKRDFTHVTDVVKYISKLIKKNPLKTPPYQILNIANSQPEKLKIFLKKIEKHFGKKANIQNLSMQKGDVKNTYGDTKKIISLTGYKSTVNIEKGLKEFFIWFDRNH